MTIEDLAPGDPELFVRPRQVAYFDCAQCALPLQSVADSAKWICGRPSTTNVPHTASSTAINRVCTRAAIAANLNLSCITLSSRGPRRRTTRYPPARSSAFKNAMYTIVDNSCFYRVGAHQPQDASAPHPEPHSPHSVPHGQF